MRKNCNKVRIIEKGVVVNLCPGSKCHVDSDEIATSFFSEKDAIEFGWRKRELTKFCAPEYVYAWVCPVCWN